MCYNKAGNLIINLIDAVKGWAENILNKYFNVLTRNLNSMYISNTTGSEHWNLCPSEIRQAAKEVFDINPQSCLESKNNRIEKWGKAYKNKKLNKSKVSPFFRDIKMPYWRISEIIQTTEGFRQLNGLFRELFNISL